MTATGYTAPVSPHRQRAALTGLVLLRIALDLHALLARPLNYWHWEEAYNASAAWVIAQTGAWSSLLDLQYKTFCGGCSVLTATAAPLLSATGDQWLAWKALAIGWNAATIVAGFTALRRWGAPAAGLLFAALLALPPRGLFDASLMLWGNHPQSNLLVLGMLALAAAPVRPLAFGILAGLSLWFGRVSLYAVAVLLPWTLLKTRDPRVLLGTIVGMLPMLLPAAAGDGGEYDLSLMGNLLPDGLAGASWRMAPLVYPPLLAQHLLGGPQQWPLAVVLLAMATAGTIRTLTDPKRRPIALLGIVFLAAVGISGFNIHRLGPDMTPFGSRYHAPWGMILLLQIAVGMDGLLEKRRQWIVAAAIVGLGLVSRGPHIVAPPTATAMTLQATNLHDFGAFLAGRIPPDRLETMIPIDRKVDALFRRTRGYQRGLLVRRGRLGRDDAIKDLDPEGLWGVGQALVAQPASPQQIASWNQWLSSMPMERAIPIGRGLAFQLAMLQSHAGQGAPQEITRAAVEAVQVGLAPGTRCWLCSAAGQRAVEGCRRVPRLKLSTCLRGVHNSIREDEVLFGAGLAAISQPREPLSVQRLEAEFTELSWISALQYDVGGMQVSVRLQTYLHWEATWLR